MSLTSVALFIILSVSVLGTNEKQNFCKDFDEKCYENKDCCTRNCHRFFRWIPGHCKESVGGSISNDVKKVKAQNGKCLFRYKNERENKHLYKQFGESASHFLLLPGTHVSLTIGNSTTQVVINNEIPREPGAVLDLSVEAANKLGIFNAGFYPCEIKINAPKTFTLFYVVLVVLFMLITSTLIIYATV